MGAKKEKQEKRERTEETQEHTPHEEVAGTFGAYAEYNKILRTWLVAFGVGGPAIFLVNDKLAAALVQAQQLRLVVILFLAGTAAQVLGALLNKIANWYVYQSMVSENPSGLKFSLAEWFVNQFWPDMILDVATIAAFGYAAWLLLTVFAKT